MRYEKVFLFRSLALACALSAPACRGDAAASGPAVRDSAGVRVVESTRAQWGEAPSWTVEPEPVLQVGTMDGAAEYQLDGVSGAVRLADGGVVVADGGSRELRWYDGDGKFLRAAGRAGGGPGEFQTLDGLAPYRGDSVAAWDARQSRLSVFGAAGGFGRGTTVPEVGGVSALLRGVFPDGSFVLEPTGTAEAFMRMQPGERRDSVSYVRYTAEGALADTLASLADRELLASREGNRISQQSLLFGRDSYCAAGGGLAYAGESDAFRIDVFDAGGARVMSIRRPGAPRTPSHAEVRAARGAAEARRQATEARVARVTGGAVSRVEGGDVPARATVPAFDQLVADAEGNLWVREYQIDPAQPGRWAVFDRGGQWLGVVEVPAGLHVYQIGPDWILARVRDELEVEYVRVYRLVRR